MLNFYFKSWFLMKPYNFQCILRIIAFGCIFCVKGSHIIIYYKFINQFNYNEFNLKSYFLCFLGTTESFLLDNIKISREFNFLGAVQPLTYPVELNVELVTWVLALRGVYFPVSVLSFHENAKLVLEPHNPSFFSQLWLNG